MIDCSCYKQISVLMSYLHQPTWLSSTFFFFFRMLIDMDVTFHTEVEKRALWGWKACEYSVGLNTLETSSSILWATSSRIQKLGIKWKRHLFPTFLLYNVDCCLWISMEVEMWFKWREVQLWTFSQKKLRTQTRKVTKPENFLLLLEQDKLSRYADQTGIDSKYVIRMTIVYQFELKELVYRPAALNFFRWKFVSESPYLPELTGNPESCSFSLRSILNFSVACEGLSESGVKGGYKVQKA